MKVLTVFGTRPEAIKLAPVLKELEKTPGAESYVCVTGQHQEMLWQVLDVFGIRPDWDLAVMQHNQTLSHVTREVLIGVENILANGNFDFVVVQGDTTTVLATAIAAFYRGVPVAHVEAGLRTYDNRHPFPEEFNRRVTDIVGDLLFAPTEGAKQNLCREGLPESRISVTGNTVVDALHWILENHSSHIPNLSLRSGTPLILVTVHRRENHGKPLEQICKAVRTLATNYPTKSQFLLPVHPNPNIRSVVHDYLGDVPNIHLTKPLAYDEFVGVLSQAYFVMTDSGGILEESVSLGKPILIMRNETEREEALSAGVGKLVGTDCDRIVAEAEVLLTNTQVYNKMTRASNIFGDGRASARIVNALLQEMRNRAY